MVGGFLFVGRLLEIVLGFGLSHIFTATALAVIVAFLPRLEALAIGLLAFGVFADAAASGNWHRGHNLVFETDAADTAVAHQTHVIGFAGADAVVLKTVAVVALAVVAGAFVGVTRPPDIPRVFLNVHRILIVAG